MVFIFSRNLRVQTHNMITISFHLRFAARVIIIIIIYNYIVLLQSIKYQPEYFILGTVCSLLVTRVFYARHQECNFLLAIFFCSAASLNISTVHVYYHVLTYLHTYKWLCSSPLRNKVIVVLVKLCYQTSYV